MNKQSGLGICMIVTLIIIAVLWYELYKDYKGVTNEHTTQSVQEN